MTLSELPAMASNAVQQAQEDMALIAPGRGKSTSSGVGFAFSSIRGQRREAISRPALADSGAKA
ncbi:MULTISPECIES: hypothetical protein [Sinorhizobium]|uniref:Uncharacterized protein n=1 Tax=Sinorhizobium kummerowiae TaxID=158892 RepID=A0ABY8TDZ7_9HYPH|nr:MULTISPECIES: hypothetical protein [Sinorhizobium]MQW29586.1 hypothetical protein [Sinorhizobium meliloti]MQX93564.1 hypothetical protein [Sinorhizobium meliloti]RVG75887.1 hypothetical protein CN219_32210 [Sinorhizobium meliloti]RVI20785.1 hypothetical protein CN197_34625 [Sinorhizobium meliloti]RVI35227.1 hypothetical protein CN196_34650 [Sinorhizobium meliloti]